jgi:pimeloyl-ACP methyl ester carboxylesterase
LAQSPEALADGVTVFHTRPSRMDFLANLTCPIVFVTGADDVAPGPETNAKQAATASSGSLHLIAHCGHYVPMERPADLNAILRNVMAAAT